MIKNDYSIIEGLIGLASKVGMSSFSQLFLSGCCSNLFVSLGIKSTEKLPTHYLQMYVTVVDGSVIFF